MIEPDFTEEQIKRYSRQSILDEIGGEGQRRLLNASALVVGAGGLGSPALLYLAAAGVGRIGVADFDRVELSNLQRQVIHGTSDLGKGKTLSAVDTIRDLNPDCGVVPFQDRITAANVREAVRGSDVILDGSDNFPTRFLVADACRLEGIPLVSAAILRFDGQLMTVLPGKGNPCYRCFLPEPPPEGRVPKCRQAGILGAVAGVMGTLQAAETLKVILGIGQVLSHEILLYSALDGTFDTVKRAVNPDCALCGESPAIAEPVEYTEAFCAGTPCDDERGRRIC